MIDFPHANEEGSDDDHTACEYCGRDIPIVRFKIYWQLDEDGEEEGFTVCDDCDRELEAMQPSL